MTKARNSIINVNDTPYYHCMGRCVRRAYLCGVDEFSGKDYSHRKQWIVDKLAELSSVYSIDVCAYAVMSNHYHVVLKINQEQAQQLSDNEVIERWMQLFHGNVLIQRYLKGECHSEGELDKVKEIIAIWRERLSDISWFMRCLNESIAQKANQEDNCKGRFWEGRFKSQALLNEHALLSCMTYVDLNPIRAGIADNLENSDFTSIEQRIKHSVKQEKALSEEALSEEALSVKQEELRERTLSVKSQALRRKSESLNFNLTDAPQQIREPVSIQLADFVGSKDKTGIPYLLMDYLELVDWTGRAIREGKKGFIDSKEPKILKKLGLEGKKWLKVINHYSESFYSHIGTPEQLKAICEHSNQKWLAGIRNCRQLFHFQK